MDLCSIRLQSRGGKSWIHLAKRLASAFEGEARANGANSIEIVLHKVSETRFLNQKLWNRFGYSFSSVGDSYIVAKDLGE